MARMRTPLVLVIMLIFALSMLFTASSYSNAGVLSVAAIGITDSENALIGIQDGIISKVFIREKPVPEGSGYGCHGKGAGEFDSMDDDKTHSAKGRFWIKNNMVSDIVIDGVSCSVCKDADVELKEGKNAAPFYISSGVKKKVDFSITGIDNLPDNLEIKLSAAWKGGSAVIKIPVNVEEVRLPLIDSTVSTPSAIDMIP